MHLVWADPTEKKINFHPEKSCNTASIVGILLKNVRYYT